MTGTHEGHSTRPISVAELLAKNGTIGAPPPAGRRHRRRNNSEAVTVAELTGEIPVVRDDEDHRDDTEHVEPTTGALRTAAADRVPAQHDDEPSQYWSKPQPRWPESPPVSSRDSGPARGFYPRPVRHVAPSDGDHDGTDPQSGAERMSPDPPEDYAEIPVDVMDTEVREAEPVQEDSAYVRSYLRGTGRQLGGKAAVDTPGRIWLNYPTPRSSTSTTPTSPPMSTTRTRTRMPGRTRPRHCCTAGWWFSNRFSRWHSAPGCSSRSTSYGGGTTLSRWCCRCWSFSAWSPG